MYVITQPCLLRRVFVVTFDCQIEMLKALKKHRFLKIDKQKIFARKFAQRPQLGMTFLLNWLIAAATVMMTLYTVLS